MTTGYEVRREDLYSLIYGALSGNLQQWNHLGKQANSSSKDETKKLPSDGNSTFRYICKKTETCSYQILYTNVHNSQKLETT